MLNATKRKKAAGIQRNLRKPPPYSKPITRARRAGMVPKHLGLGHIIITLEWHPRYLRSSTTYRNHAGWPYVVMPPEENPADFDWSFCAGLDICVIHTDSHSTDLIQELAKELFNADIANLKVMNINAIHDRRDGAWLHVNPLFKGHLAWRASDA